MKLQRKLTALAVTAVAGLALGTSTTAAYATNATATVNSGGLGFATAPATFAFGAVTLGASPVTTTFAQSWDVADNTGSYAGWNVQVTAAALTSSGNTLPQPSIPGPYTPTETCDVLGQCVAATNPATITYPLALPTSATKVLNAAANTGVGNGTFNAQTYSLTIPATAHAGSYAAIWTVAVTSAP